MAAVVVACGYNERMALAGAGCFLVAKAPRHGEVDPGRRSCPRVPGGVIVVAMQRGEKESGRAHLHRALTCLNSYRRKEEGEVKSQCLRRGAAYTLNRQGWSMGLRVPVCVSGMRFLSSYSFWYARLVSCSSVRHTQTTSFTQSL